jgi:hypothetical protein
MREGHAQTSVRDIDSGHRARRSPGRADNDEERRRRNAVGDTGGNSVIAIYRDLAAKLAPVFLGKQAQASAPYPK